MPRPHGPVPGAAESGSLCGRWRYNRIAGSGIALSYDRSTGRAPMMRLPDVHAGGRFSGRWRYNRVAASGIALSYEGSMSDPSPATPAQATPPPVTHSPAVRVLCYCGNLFTFDGDEGICPGCGQPAGWPTMGEVEREMRSDLADLLRAQQQGTEPD